MTCFVYICNYCGRKFEVQQSINSKPRAGCPQCHSMARHRLISQIGGIVFSSSTLVTQSVTELK